MEHHGCREKCSHPSCVIMVSNTKFNHTRRCMEEGTNKTGLVWSLVNPKIARIGPVEPCQCCTSMFFVREPLALNMTVV